MKWTTSGASRLKANLSRSFGARRQAKSASTKRGAKPHSSSTIVVAASKQSSRGEFPGGFLARESLNRTTRFFVIVGRGNLTRVFCHPPLTWTKGRRHPCHVTTTRSRRNTNTEERRAEHATSSSRRCMLRGAIDPSRVRFSDRALPPPSSTSTIAKCTTASNTESSKDPPATEYPAVAKASGMARLERHELEDRGLEEEREERRTRSEGAKPAMDYSVLTDALAGERQEGGYHSNVVASQQASSWSSSRTPFDPTTSFDPPASLLVEAAERQAILLQELARRGMAFPAAVASSHGELPYSLCSNELPSSESRMRINQTTLKPRTANDQALRDSRDCQWPLMRFFDNGAEVNTQGQPLSQLNGNPVQLRDEKPADERRKDLCKREGNFLSSSSTPIDSSFKTEQQQHQRSTLFVSQLVSQAQRTAIVGAEQAGTSCFRGRNDFEETRSFLVESKERNEG